MPDYSSTAVSDDEIAAAAAGHPCFVGPSVVRYDTGAANALPKLTTGGSFGNQDQSHPGSYAFPPAPARLAIDGRGKAQAYPDVIVPPSSIWYLLLICHPGKSFDTIALINHDMGGMANLTVSVEIADNSTFTDDLQEIATTSSINSVRHVFWTLDASLATPKRFTGVTHIRIKMSKSTDFAALSPKIGEVWVGRRYQLTRGFNRPVDLSGKRSEFASRGDAYAHHSVRTIYRGKNVFRARLLPNDTNPNLQDTSTLRSLAGDTEHGSFPMLLVKDPAASPHDAQIMRIKNSQAFFVPERESSLQREVNLPLEEQPPFLEG